MGTIADLAQVFSTHPLTRGAPWKAWMRFLDWQIRSRIKDEVVFSWIEGQRLAVRSGMTGATGNIYMGLHEFCDMMLLLHFLREGDLFLDIGSNVGSYTVLASGIRRATTWAFEPDPETVRALKRNVEINGIQDRVVVHEFALGDSDGELSFTYGLDTMNRVAKKQEANVRMVCVRRLDSLVGVNRPLMIKLDVEGFEEHVVRGAKYLLAGQSLKLIELETITAEIEATFSHYRFARGYYDPFRRSLTRHPNSDLPSSNAVFVRDWDFVIARLAVAPPVNIFGKLI
jgi:FkbM family methyltransferase